MRCGLAWKKLVLPAVVLVCGDVLDAAGCGVVWPLRPATATEAALVVADVAETVAPFVEEMWLPARRRIEEVDELTYEARIMLRIMLKYNNDLIDSYCRLFLILEY